MISEITRIYIERVQNYFLLDNLCLRSSCIIRKKLRNLENHGCFVGAGMAGCMLSLLPSRDIWKHFSRSKLLNHKINYEHQWLMVETRHASNLPCFLRFTIHLIHPTSASYIFLKTVFTAQFLRVFLHIIHVRFVYLFCCDVVDLSIVYS